MRAGTLFQFLDAEHRVWTAQKFGLRQITGRGGVRRRLRDDSGDDPFDGARGGRGGENQKGESSAVFGVLSTQPFPLHGAANTL